MSSWKQRLLPALTRLGWSGSCVTGCIYHLCSGCWPVSSGYCHMKKANLTCQTYLEQTLTPSLSQSFDRRRAVAGMVTSLKGDTANSTFCSFTHFLYICFIAISEYFHSNGSQMPVLNIWNQLQLVFILPVVMRWQTQITGKVGIK